MLVAEDKREEPPRVNPLQLRNAITHEKPTSAGLMYVEIVLNEMATLLVRWSIRGGLYGSPLSQGFLESKHWYRIKKRILLVQLLRPSALSRIRHN